MKITIEKLNDMGACSKGIEWFKNQSETNGKKLVIKLVAENKLDFANWSVVRLLNRKRKIQYAIFAAEQVIELYEKEHPEDKRPRRAIDAAKKILEKNTVENRNAANAATNAANAATNAATNAAYAAAYAANAATNAANAATNAANAAYAAAYAANAANAAYAATTAAYAANAANAAYAATTAANAANAAYAAAYAAAMKTKIINYGISLLK